MLLETYFLRTVTWSPSVAASRHPSRGRRPRWTCCHPPDSHRRPLAAQSRLATARSRRWYCPGS